MGNAKEEPMKKDDHGPEALGRFFAGLFGTPSAQKRGTRVHKAVFGTSNPLPEDVTSINPDGTLNRRFSRAPDNSMGRQKATKEHLAATKKRKW